MKGHYSLADWIEKPYSTNRGPWVAPEAAKCDKPDELEKEGHRIIMYTEALIAFGNSYECEALGDDHDALVQKQASTARAYAEALFARANYIKARNG